MKAATWFEAQGQRMRAHGRNWHELKVLTHFYSLPLFARKALARGHMRASSAARAGRTPSPLPEGSTPERKDHA